MSKSNKVVSVCNICGVPAIYSYYGVIACSSCKMFFKRNAENKKRIFKCDFDNQCQVNIHNRHVCSACRLAKCFQVGMCTEMIRSSRPTKRKTESTYLWKNKRPQQLRPLNLLEQDQSLLSNDQWTILSNLIHLYDEHNALQIAEDFLKEFHSLHPKLRFKIDSSKVLELSKIFYAATEPFILSNHDFTSLPHHERSVALRGAVDNVSCLGGSFILRQSGLITDSAFRIGLENTFGSIPFDLTLIEISLLDQDINIVKLTLSIFAFCTSRCTLFDENTPFMCFRDQQGFLHIQNLYAELTWKYLLYKYSFDQAVRRFNNLVRCLIISFTIRTHLQSLKNHTDVVDSLIRKIEQQQLSTDDN